MWVGNHSWTHPHLTQMSQAQMQSELSQTQNAIRSATGTTPRLFRPPYGETNGTLRAVEQSLGLTEVIWDVDSQDWNGASTAAIVQAAGRLTNGQVILMHDGIQNTINAIPQIMSGLAEPQPVPRHDLPVDRARRRTRRRRPARATPAAAAPPASPPARAGATATT